MILTFDDIPNKTAVYLDANIFIYFFSGRSLECEHLIRRCKRQEVFGILSTLTLVEFGYKAMCFEAEEITRRAAVNSMYLKKHPDVVKRLLKYNIAMEDLLYRDNLQILDVTPDDVLGSFAVRQKYGLLMKDSITAYLLKKIRIPAIATNDRDFENIEDVQVYRPTDTPSTRNVV